MFIGWNFRLGFGWRSNWLFFRQVLVRRISQCFAWVNLCLLGRIGLLGGFDYRRHFFRCLHCLGFLRFLWRNILSLLQLNFLIARLFRILIVFGLLFVLLFVQILVLVGRYIWILLLFLFRCGIDVIFCAIISSILRWRVFRLLDIPLLILLFDLIIDGFFRNSSRGCGCSHLLLLSSILLGMRGSVLGLVV